MMRFLSIIAVLLVLCLCASLQGVTAQEGEGEGIGIPSEDNMPPDAVEPEAVWSIAWSPDGSKIVMGVGPEQCNSPTNDYSIRIIDAATQQLIKKIGWSNHCSITNLDWNPDSTKIIASGLSTDVMVWNVSTGQGVASFTSPSEHGFVDNAWSPDGSKIASIPPFEAEIMLWDPLNGETLFTFDASPATSITWSPDGSKLATGSKGGEIFIWNPATGQLVTTFPRHSKIVSSVVWSPSGNQIASAEVDGTIYIWDVDTKAQLLTLQGHTGFINEVVWSPNGTNLSSASNDGTVRVWDSVTGDELSLFQSTDRIYSVDWSPDGNQLAFGGAGGTEITIVHLPIAGNESATAQAVPRTYVSSVAWSPDGAMIAIGRGTDSCESDPNLYTIQILDAVTQEIVKSLSGSTCAITSIDWSPDGTKLAASSLDGIGTRVWDVQSGQLLMVKQTGGQGIASVKWRPPDGLQLASASISSGIGILDPETGKTVSLAPIGGNSLDWSPDGTKLVSGSAYENRVYVADMVTGKQIMALTELISAVEAVAWSPDGTKLASGGGIDDPTVHIWDATTGANLLTLEAHTDAIIEVVWSPDSTKLASASSDNTVRVWDGVTGDEVCLFQRTHRIYGVDWSPDGSQLAFGGGDGEITIVQLDSCPQKQNQIERK